MRQISKMLFGLLLLCSAVSFLGAEMCCGMEEGCPMTGKMGKGKGMMPVRDRSPGERILRMAKKLNLTDPQVTQIQGFETEFKHYQIDRDAELAGLKMKLRNLGEDEKVLAETKELINKIHQTKADLQYKRLEARTKIMAVLTAEQKAQLESMKEEIMEKMKEKKGKYGKGKREGREGKKERPAK